jgi:hypothetical protein
MRKREAQRLLQPFLDRVNSSISAPSREHNSAIFNGFADIWERDYMALSKPTLATAACFDTKTASELPALNDA